ncbi:MAG: hypothetical protein R3F61_16050 [Myxococcota bacterium]
MATEGLSRAGWLRDGVLAVLLGDLGGIVGIAVVVFAKSGVANLMDSTMLAILAVSASVSLVLGPLLGLAFRALTDLMHEQPLALMFAGVPAGGAVGLAHVLLLNPFIGSSGDRTVFFLIGLVGGTIVGTVGWPGYMALAITGRARWPALLVFPVVASAGVLIPIGVGLLLI